MSHTIGEGSSFFFYLIENLLIVTNLSITVKPLYSHFYEGLQKTHHHLLQKLGKDYTTV